MPTQPVEIIDLENWPGDAATYQERNFAVRYAEDEDAARAAVAGDGDRCPISFTTPTGLTLLRRPIEAWTEGGLHYVRVRWELPDKPSGEAAPEETPEVKSLGRFVGFDTTGGTMNLTQSIRTVNTYTAPGHPYAAPNFGGAINVGEDGAVEGVEIPTGSFKLNVEREVPTSEVTPDLIRAIYRLYGKVNDAAVNINIYGRACQFEKGELRFMGGQSTQIDDKTVRLTFALDASPNATGLTVGTISNIAKEGWEYLWLRYAAAADDPSKTVVQTPVAAYVEQVHHYGDFSAVLPILNTGA